MIRTPREIVEQVGRMAAGESVDFAALFAADGVLRYPFAPPGTPRELRGRDAIRAFHDPVELRRSRMLDVEGADVIVRATDDPEIVIAEVEHYGHSYATGRPYRFRLLGVIRVRNGEIVSYDDYIDPIAMATLFGRTADLIATLSTP
ncbi:nuclear transport factor 2 family protein [Micromonospora musae]|uniref:Nuclear transport factor 2 family protein n=1 Tax=Micromonospora musae TaxID=1894970 RepID=A0A3A9YHK0_9ACTN|nr:nuclear transport factor 2 family protein [Micromonospora musae]RKN21059.1 nuclear transport factor 2 family protein [Micromonospora musae]RKN36598.1 nuclear transport factor 2 family protein [Micromonospora musae]